MAGDGELVSLGTGASVRLFAPALCHAPLLDALHEAASNGTAVAGLLTFHRWTTRPDGLPSFRQLAARAEQLARALPRCGLPPRPQAWQPSAELEEARDIGDSAADAAAEATAMQAAVGVAARSQAKVASALSTSTAARLKTRFLILIVLFIKNVVIPNYLCPPVTDGLMSYIGPTLAHNLVAPLVQGCIEAGSPKTVNVLGAVIGIFLGLILFMRLLVMLTITLGDGITFVIETTLNREMGRVITNFCNLHLLTAEVFMILHDVNARVTGNVVNRLGLSLTHALTHTVTHRVTHKILHHYYCIYCYYYGNFCDFCYRYDELTYMHRLWGFGQGKCEECSSPRSVSATIAKDSEKPRVDSNAAPKGRAASGGVDGGTPKPTGGGPPT